MDYRTVKEVASSWEISPRRVSVLCSEGRIEGVEKIGNIFLIPKSAKKPIDGRTNRKMNTTKAKPFVKWAGGKGQLLDIISDNLPSNFGKEIKKYAEPFVGGGAVLFDMLQKYQLEGVYISDTNKWLINTYCAIRDYPNEVIFFLEQFQKEYLPASDEERKLFFYKKRDEFNEIKSVASNEVMLASLFIFLNRTCFNGLYRVNSKGNYNVPIGSYKNPQICDNENILSCSKLLKKVEIVCGDYKNSEKFIDDKTFVYFDPPYRPLSVTSSFTSYTEQDFNDKNQIELCNYAKKLSELGAYVLLSNSDPKNTNESDEFFDELYADFNIQRVFASRMINSKSSSRGKISELLIKNY